MKVYQVVVTFHEMYSYTEELVLVSTLKESYANTVLQILNTMYDKPFSNFVDEFTKSKYYTIVKAYNLHNSLDDIISFEIKSYDLE